MAHILIRVAGECFTGCEASIRSVEEQYCADDDEWIDIRITHRNIYIYGDPALPARPLRASLLQDHSLALLNRGVLSQVLTLALLPLGYATSITPDQREMLLLSTVAHQEDDQLLEKAVEIARLESSNAHQENDKLLHKAMEVVRLFAENERLRGSELSLEQGQLSTVAEVERIQQEAKKGEKKLPDQRIEAQRKLSDAIDPRTHETLRNQFDLVCDGYFRARAERNAANAALSSCGERKFRMTEGHASRNYRLLQGHSSLIQPRCSCCGVKT